MESQTLSAGADDIGLFEVYYDRENKEYCAELRHAGVTVGKPTYTRVSLAECKDWSCREVTDAVRYDDDPGYVEKAGPVRLKARPQGQCVVANGMMKHGTDTHTVRGLRHCR